MPRRPFVSLVVLLVALVVVACAGASTVTEDGAGERETDGAAGVSTNDGPTGGADNGGSDGDTSADEPAAGPASLELRFDETVEHDDLEIRWLDLNDSRCPIGVQCIWEGQIVARFEVAREGDEPVEAELVLRAGTEPKTARAFARELRLEGVEPHPKKGVTPERADYLARIAISGG